MPGNISLKLHSWKTPSAKADIIFSHGFLDHAARYHREAAFFNSNNINFLSYDLRAHGLSSGITKAYIPDFNAHLDDLESILEFYQAGSKRPYFLMAHSMGGLIQISFLLNKNHELNQDFKGLILSAPLLAPNADMAPVLQKLSPLISKLFPKLKTVKLDVREISNDPNEIEAYKSDPLISHDAIYARSANVLLEQMKSISGRFDRFTYPFIIQHSPQDQLTEYLGSKIFFENASSNDKTLHALESFKHEITKDIGHETVLDRYLQWINSRL